MWFYCNHFPFFGTSASVGPTSLSIRAMSSKRKEYKVDACTRKAALFFLACEPNPVTRLSIPAAMRAKGYSDAEAADQILVQQVRRESQKNKSNDTPRPESAAASSLLALATVAPAASSRPALQTITPNQEAAPTVTVAGMNAGILSSQERKVRKTSHQEQISKQNERKRKVVRAQAHARNHSRCQREGIAEGGSLINRTGDRAGRGGVQGTRPWCYPKQEYNQSIRSTWHDWNVPSCPWI